LTKLNLQFYTFFFQLWPNPISQEISSENKNKIRDHYLMYGIFERSDNLILKNLLMIKCACKNNSKV